MEKVIILDFGSQYTQLIARRLRELKVYSEILPYNSELDLADPHLKAVILSGSPFSVNDPNALHLELAPILDKKPILGICYCLLYTSPSPRDATLSRMPSSA